MVKIIRAENPGVVQTWMYHADLLGGLAAKRAGVKKIVWGIHHTTLNRKDSKLSTILVARLCALLSAYIPRRIICCAKQSAVVHRKLGYSEEKLVVIPNGYDLSVFKPDSASGAEFRGSLGIPPGKFLVGNVGRFSLFKDHENLLGALREVKDRGVDFLCLLVGKGLTSANGPLVARLQELGLSEKIMFLGQRSDIPAVMNALDLHILSSSSEAFPNVLAEAMACGTPCISTDVGDAVEIIGDESLVCPPRNYRALADLTLKMQNEWANNPHVWRQRSSYGVEHIKNHFSIERMVQSYEACWFERHH